MAVDDTFETHPRRTHINSLQPRSACNGRLGTRDHSTLFPSFMLVASRWMQRSMIQMLACALLLGCDYAVVAPIASSQQDLASVDIGILRAEQKNRPLAPYVSLFPVKSPAEQVAEEIIQNGWALGKHEPFPITAPIDWNHLRDEDRSWSFHLHSWDPIEALMVTYQLTSSSRYLDSCLEVAEDWIRSNPPEDPTDDDIETDTAESLSLLDHLAYLENDENFVSHNNHGFYQAAGQLAATKRFDWLTPMNQAEVQAAGRVNQLIDDQFTPEGVHREHSPGYHLMVYESLRAIAEAGFVEHDVALCQKFRKIEEALAWMIMPNGHLVMFGDTDSRSVDMRPLPDASCESQALRFGLTVGQEGQAPQERIKAFPQSGLVVLRSDWSDDPETYPSASYLAQQCAFHSRTHKHADDLSFVWYDHGGEILIDPGRYGYIGETQPGSALHEDGFWYSDPKRIYVESTRAHNTVEIDGRNFQRKGRKPYGSALERYGEIDGVLFAESHVRHFRTMRHARVLLHRPHEWLIVFDWVWDNEKEDHQLRQWFHFAPALSATVANTNTLYVSGTTLPGPLQVTSLVDNAQMVTPVRGQEEPILQGWWSPRRGVFEPTWSVCWQQEVSTGGSFATLFAFGDDVSVERAKNRISVSGREAHFTWRQGNSTHILHLQRPAEGNVEIAYSMESE